MCYYSQMIINRKYVKNQKNGGIVPPLPDTRVKYVPIGCGNCKECRKQKAREWQVRLMEDIKENKNGKFVTFTFSNESIAELIEEEITQKKKDGKDEQGKPKFKIVTTKIKDLQGYERDNQIATKAIRHFNENWRKKYGKAVRHWMVTELGHNGTENIHLHGIIWTNESIEAIREKWKYGWIWPRPKYKGNYYVNNQTVNYIVKYITKRDNKHKEYKQIVLTSPGIGGNYKNSHRAQQNIAGKTETYKTSTGHEVALPIYWRNHIWTEEDREELWIKKLNKEERWLNGMKYPMKTAEDIDNYNKAVMQARKENHALGYGGRANEDRKKYEEQQRDIMLNTRLKKYKMRG